MHRILFVEDEVTVLAGLQRALYPMRASWDMTFVRSGEDALNQLATSHYDVLVTDIKMPGMSGIELLAQVVKRYPSLIRIVLSGALDLEITLRSAALAHQFLAKPCPTEGLQRAIEHALKNSYLLDNQALKQLISRMPSLPTIPAIYSELREVLQRPSAQIEEICHVLAQDLALSARVIQLANSSGFAAEWPIQDIAGAVARLGIPVMRSVMLAAFMKFDDTAIRDSLLEQFRDHGLAVASLSRQIAASVNLSGEDVDRCFSGGLLHDVGKLVLANNYPETYEGLMARAIERDLPTWELEAATLGNVHSEVGAYLLWLWGIPESLTEIVALHHTPTRATGSTRLPVLIVHVADALINGRPRDISMENLQSVGWVGHLHKWQELAALIPQKT